ncbi:M3 family oligoendopeptidase [Thermotalea metallivorans]|uniref:Oligoendopeptidase F, plasmid n=1 Tax=Thermotalea metallivorans TaxID=520762 RepID=A0A140KZS7_9FIRM|nr:M3 family oligoendopeptidase [Thermotalea metallivorans]KXG73802.1 Oligoendopeptidase F, plasmid [Thermotalea metallivorans]
MEMRWSLDALYPSFESEVFQEDLKKCDEEIESMKRWAEENLISSDRTAEKMETYIQMQNRFFHLFTRLLSFGELRLSVNARDEKALQIVERLESKGTELAKPMVMFQKWINNIDNLDEVIASSKILEEHRFYLEEIKKNSRYLLSEKEEILIAKMKNTGSNAWSKLQELLTSTLLVDMTVDGEKKRLPLTVVRNMAHDPNPDVRRTAYEAELKAYPKIEESSAAALNGIKGEVITLAQMRGYDSPLEETLMNSRMDRETLEAMLTAIRESLPAFHRYYKRKAALLGHDRGLPFYDLFAPMGGGKMQLTYREAKDFIVENFRTFSERLANYAHGAFEKGWIDGEPREGKRGGAFCANLHAIGESRILLNFTGTFHDVKTLAHELGHGYHGYCLVGETYLNSHYPMPIAETASIFCETIIQKAALKTASLEEAFAILESSLMGAGQVIVDIYSRFLFESELFRRREEGSLSVNELKEMMIKAQKEAYGDGLAHDVLHPYMWINKPHYYDASHNYYNFPYAFGLLFAKGLYAEYLKRGESFVQEYDRLLSVTGKKTIADVAAMMGIDIHSIDFWRSSLKLIEEEIDNFISLKP